MGKVVLQALVAFGTWFVSGLGIRALVVGAVYWVLQYLVPIIWGYVAPFASLSSLDTLFAAIPDGIYWGLYAFKFDVGLPLIISAYIGRFLIRRLPIVG